MCVALLKIKISERKKKHLANIKNCADPNQQSEKNLYEIMPFLELNRGVCVRVMCLNVCADFLFLLQESSR